MTTNQMTLPLVALAACAFGAVGVVAGQGCSPEAQRITGPIVAASPMACAMLPAGSADREVCDASTALARALARLAQERGAQDSAALEPSAAPPASASGATSAGAPQN